MRIGPVVRVTDVRSKEVIYLRRFLEEVGIKSWVPTMIWNDKQEAQKLPQNNVFSLPNEED